MGKKIYVNTAGSNPLECPLQLCEKVLPALQPG